MKNILDLLISLPFNNISNNEADKIQSKYNEGLKFYKQEDLVKFQFLEKKLGNITDITLEEIDGDKRQYLAHIDNKKYYLYFTTEPNENNIHVLTKIILFNTETEQLSVDSDSTIYDLNINNTKVGSLAMNIFGDYEVSFDCKVNEENSIYYLINFQHIDDFDFFAIYKEVFPDSDCNYYVFDTNTDDENYIPKPILINDVKIDFSHYIEYRNKILK